MKKLLLTACAMTLAVGAFAQGQVQLISRVSNGNAIHTYFNANVFTQVRGNGATDAPVGATDWSGYTALTGAGYMAALLSAPAGGDPYSSMNWASGTTTYRTGTGAGFVAGPVVATLGNVAADAASAELVMFAWDTKGGQYTTPQAAWDAWKLGLTSAGTSATFTLTGIGGGTITPPAIVNSLGLTSFNIYTIPEPSTMALAGLGAAALLIFRRRK